MNNFNNMLATSQCQRVDDVSTLFAVVVSVSFAATLIRASRRFRVGTISAARVLPISSASTVTGSVPNVRRLSPFCRSPSRDAKPCEQRSSPPIDCAHRNMSLP